MDEVIQLLYVGEACDLDLNELDGVPAETKQLLVDVALSAAIPREADGPAQVLLDDCVGQIIFEAERR